MTFDQERRDAEMESLYRDGVTLDDIAVRFGVTGERVRQICTRRGVPKRFGATVRKMRKAQERTAKRGAKLEAQTLLLYGCSYAVAKEFNSGLAFSTKGCRARAYMKQRKNSIQRGIAWNITFPEWCRVWDESGKWDQRGRGQYCMVRLGDSGPYEAGNVEVITIAQNASDSFVSIPAKKRVRYVINDPAHMSPRVQEVAKLLLEGLTLPQIAENLGISRSVAWQYAHSARTKLKILAARQKERLAA